jgi:hypothetical protein
MERERREEKGGEGMDAPGAGPPKIFGLEPPLVGDRGHRRQRHRGYIPPIFGQLGKKYLISPQ